MSATPAINPGLASLFQTLSNVGSPLLSSPQAVAALQKASPADIVQLSAEATQLEGLNVLLGVSNSTPSGAALPGATLPDSTATDPFASLEAAVAAATASGSTAPSPSSAPTLSLADAIASYERSAQSGEIASLFGTGISAASTTGSTFFG